MTLQTWWLFVMAVFLLSGTPGPNMLHILQRSVDFGVRRTVAAMAGCLAGLMTILTASAAGLTALLLAIPGAFEVLRWLGTAYLVWLGIKAWRADPTPTRRSPTGASPRPSSSAGASRSASPIPRRCSSPPPSSPSS